MFLKYKIGTILSFILIIGLAACSDSSTGVSEDQEATIHGSIETNQSQAKAQTSNSNVEGTTVTAARITTDGSFETIAGTETEANASGEFSLQVDVNAANQIVVIAEHSEGELRGFISAEIENNQSYRLKPLNGESTAETAVFAEIVSVGNADIVWKTDIETVIRPETAAEINAESSASADIATAITNYAEARAEFFFAEAADGDGEAILEQSADLIAEAQFEYETNAEAAADSEDLRAAFKSLIDAKIDAYTEAGAQAGEVATMIHMQKNALHNSISNQSEEIQNSVRASASLYAATAVDFAAQTNAEASGMSETTVSAIADAGADLKTEIEASSGASSEIEAAFEAYHEEVRTAMENDSNVEAQVIVDIDAEINSNGGAKFVFENAISGVIDANLLGDIYTTFTSSVESEVESRSEDLVELDLEAMAEIFILINLYS
ncbi:hypothetical protein DYD21_00055 [Rhodohalobacter sp. SW132]|uniref:hypothetical protein n=1 Tax=Rhodohalobacter sp. SW132 TaxID=2293433 RepID=UPI000E232684|nr:hypothetical protein [Rhodohalobacter sp. SW132]REL38387.1 hypothetical protein DYD21_00055 [Rhodohalobacter sp. SW132]